MEAAELERLPVLGLVVCPKAGTHRASALLSCDGDDGGDWYGGGMLPDLEDVEDVRWRSGRDLGGGDMV